MQTTTITERRCSACFDEISIDPRSGIAGGLCEGATVVEDVHQVTVAPSPREVQAAVAVLGEWAIDVYAPAGLGSASPEQLAALVAAAR